MDSVNFDEDGIDRDTYAPFIISKRDLEQPNSFGNNTEYSLLLASPDLLWYPFGNDTIDGYYLNGYGIENLIMACRHKAGLGNSQQEVRYDSEAGGCYMYFNNLENTLKTAHLLHLIKDKESITAMIKFAKQTGFTD